jgi:anti-anti-sigma regulatory factor
MAAAPAWNEEPAAAEAQRGALRRDREALVQMRSSLEVREAKLGEAQSRLATEWQNVHAERAGLATYAQELARAREAIDLQSQMLVNEMESLERHRRELATRAEQLEKMEQRLKAEMRKLKQGGSPSRPAEAPKPSPEAETLPVILDPLDPLEALDANRHNKVFRTEQSGYVLVVTPLEDASKFRDADVHVESNKVRRLLESGCFQNLVVDLGHAPFFGLVSLKAIVQMARIASNRGGRAVMCNASDQTRRVIESMNLSEWPLVGDRDEALRAVNPAGGG